MNKARLERLGLLPPSILVKDAAMAWDGSDNDSLDIDNSEDDHLDDLDDDDSM
jgi:hypothetical protein